MGTGLDWATTDNDMMAPERHGKPNKRHPDYLTLMVDNACKPPGRAGQCEHIRANLPPLLA
ncbi:hypothetical protein CFAM422_008858 [Trichoderma lentiforme]|uniref:Uncharacterized protein n=1 Tax=Trichoderma lentiforme TaxID=1567552 RepID=A0A9P4X8Y1_9HYPO|nr:hypothetical protein CFAM422_008858 [Trichoderma lentiforme]